MERGNTEAFAGIIVQLDEVHADGGLTVVEKKYPSLGVTPDAPIGVPCGHM